MKNGHNQAAKLETCAIDASPDNCPHKKSIVFSSPNIL